MCILFLSIKQHPDYPLIICANRDEFHQRPTERAHFWQQYPHTLAGKDLQAGGSWLGINKAGYFAAITNIRTGNSPEVGKKSRGELVTWALKPNSIINEAWLQQYSQQYNPFNLIYGSLNNLACFNSILNEQTLLTEGIHAISNGSINDVWPKMTHGVGLLDYFRYYRTKLLLKKSTCQVQAYHWYGNNYCHPYLFVVKITGLVPVQSSCRKRIILLIFVNWNTINREGC